MNWASAFSNREPVNPEPVDHKDKRIKLVEKDEGGPIEAAASVTAVEEPYYGIAHTLFGKPDRGDPRDSPDVLFRMNENKEIFIRELGKKFQPSNFSIFELKTGLNLPLKKAPRIGTLVSDIIFNEDIRTSEKNIYIAAITRINDQDFGHVYVIIVTEKFNFYSFGANAYMDPKTKKSGVMIRSPDDVPLSDIIDIGILTEDMKQQIFEIYAEPLLFHRFNLTGYNCAAILTQIFPHINCSPFGPFINTPTLCQPLPPNPPNYINTVLDIFLRYTTNDDDDKKTRLFNEIVQYISDVKTGLGHNRGRKKKRKSCKKKRRKTYKKRKGRRKTYKKRQRQ